ncbi:MAG: hypothetical protein QNJ44_24020 [Rhodobacter sp.]|nr:hypothetical protein [Rhodobacter sp.]
MSRLQAKLFGFQAVDRRAVHQRPVGGEAVWKLAEFVDISSFGGRRADFADGRPLNGQILPSSRF